MDKLELAELPAELAERIREEAAENDELYRRRPLDTLDLSRVHYCHSEMVNWAIGQIGNLKGAHFWMLVSATVIPRS